MFSRRPLSRERTRERIPRQVFAMEEPSSKKQRLSNNPPDSDFLGLSDSDEEDANAQEKMFEWMSEGQKVLSQKLRAESSSGWLPIVKGNLTFMDGIKTLAGSTDEEFDVVNKLGGPKEKATYMEGPMAFYLSLRLQQNRAVLVLFGTADRRIERNSFNIRRSFVRMLVDNVTTREVEKLQGLAAFEKQEDETFKKNDAETVATSVEKSFVYRALKKGFSLDLAKKCCPSKLVPEHGKDGKAEQYVDFYVRGRLGKPSMLEPFNKAATNYEWIKDATGFAFPVTKHADEETGEEAYVHFSSDGRARPSFEIDLPLGEDGSWEPTTRSPVNITKYMQDGSRKSVDAEQLAADFPIEGGARKDIMIFVEYDISQNSKKPGPSLRRKISEMAYIERESATSAEMMRSLV